MTDQPTPQPDVADPTEQTLVYNLLHAGLVLLGTTGIVVPPLLGTPSVLMTISGALVTMAGAGMSLYSHWKKNRVINTHIANQP